MQGNALLTLTVDGRRPTPAGTPIQQYEPFGQPTPDSPVPAAGTAADFGWQQNQSDGPLTHLGVRALHTRLGTFLQPDPRPHGSQAGPYSYTNADPVNQADPTGLCVGWGCVKEADQFLQPITDAATLFACVLGFGIACFVTSLLRLAVSVLNLAADFELHQDAAADGVTVALAFLNVVAATPLLYEAVRVSRVAENVGVGRCAIAETRSRRGRPSSSLPGARTSRRPPNCSARGSRARGTKPDLARSLDDLGPGNTRATYIAGLAAWSPPSASTALDITSNASTSTTAVGSCGERCRRPVRGCAVAGLLVGWWW